WDVQRRAADIFGCAADSGCSAGSVEHDQLRGFELYGQSDFPEHGERVVDTGRFYVAGRGTGAVAESANGGGRADAGGGMGGAGAAGRAWDGANGAAPEDVTGRCKGQGPAA